MKDERRQAADAHSVARLVDRTDRAATGRRVHAGVPVVDDGETLTYLHGCVPTGRHRVRVPEIPCISTRCWADQLLTPGSANAGRLTPAVLTIVGF
jgi:type IV secretion system protein VirB4